MAYAFHVNFGPSRKTDHVTADYPRPHRSHSNISAERDCTRCSILLVHGRKSMAFAYRRGPHEQES